MSSSKEGPNVGDVWFYPFLWSQEAARGETEGRKNRPTVVALRRRQAEGHLEILLVPITTKEPAGTTHSVEVPELEKKRAGLDTAIRHRVIVEQLNFDQPDRSYYFEPSGRMGAFGLGFTKILQQALRNALEERKPQSVRRR